MQNATFDENPHENERIRVTLGCAIGSFAYAKHRCTGGWLKLWPKKNFHDSSDICPMGCSAWNGRPWPGRSQNWMLMYFIINLSGSQQFSGSSIQNQVELSEWATGRFMHWGCIYSIQICEIFHQTFGPGHGKCPMCPMIFMKTGSIAWLNFVKAMYFNDIKKKWEISILSSHVGYKILRSHYSLKKFFIVLALGILGYS